MKRVQHLRFDEGGALRLWKGVLLGVILGAGVLSVSLLFDGAEEPAGSDVARTSDAMDLLMSMHPDAKRILLLGGAPEAAIPRLLAYPLQELVAVSLSAQGAERMAGGVTDSRVQWVQLTGPRLTGQVVGPFDLVINAAHGAGTLRGNRFYLVEWFQHLKGLLARDAIVMTEWSGAADGVDDGRPVGAMIYQSLNAVFPVVQVTASRPALCVAGARRIALDGAPRITFERSVLRARHRALGVAAARFESQWLTDGGPLDEAATDRLARSLRDRKLPPNRFTEMAPLRITLSSWRGLGGAVMTWAAGCTAQAKAWGVSPWFLGGGVAFVLAGLWARWRGAAWRQSATRATMAAITVLSLALGLLLTMVFPWAHGSLPLRIGLTVVTFVCGYAVGMVVGRVIMSLWRVKAWLVMTAVLLGLLLVSEAMPRVAALSGRLLEHAAMGRWVEWGFYPLLAGLGFLRGLALTNTPDAGKLHG